MDNIRNLLDLRDAVSAYVAERGHAIDCLQQIIADMMERGHSLADIDAYLTTNPFAMVDISLPQELIRAALELSS